MTGSSSYSMIFDSGGFIMLVALCLSNSSKSDVHTFEDTVTFVLSSSKRGNSRGRSRCNLLSHRVVLQILFSFFLFQTTSLLESCQIKEAFQSG